MKPNEQETRETFRDYAINDRAIYEGIEHPARLLAANLRAAISTINRKHAPEIGGADLIETEAEKRAAISVYIAEIGELLEWELIGEAPAAGLDIFRYAPRSNGAADYGALADEIQERRPIKHVKHNNSKQK